MTQMVMNDTEKQIFGLICSGVVSRSQLLTLLKEREICSRDTLDRFVKKFQKCGLLVEGIRGKYPLTQSGREEKKYRQIKPTLTFRDSGLAKVIDKLPTATHQGLIYFILSVIVAKKLLAEKLGDKGIWANFIISGRPKDIKTLLGEIICRTLNLSFEEHIQRCLGKSEAQVLGEATLIEDGLRKLRLPPYLLYPFIVWDDLDKASTRGAWNALMVYLDGRYKFEERYTPITKQVTTLATMNPKKKGGFDIPDYYLRRAFTVNSANLPCDQKENERIGADITDNPMPKLKIDGLVAVTEELKPKEKDFIRDLLYDRWITDEAKAVVDANLLHSVILGMLILQESVDVRYYSYWAVLHYLCFLETLGYTKGNWQEELNQEWGDYVYGSGGDEKFKKEWEDKAEQVKKEKARTEKAKSKVKVVEIDKDVAERKILAKYTPKIDELKKIKTSFEEMDGDKQHTVLLFLDMDLRKFRLYLPTEKRANRVTEDILRSLEIVLAEWEEQHKPIREAWEEAQKQKQRNKEKLEAILRLLTDWKAYLRRWRGKDSKKRLWTERVKPTIAKIGNCLDPKTRKKYLSKTYLDEIQSDIVALQTEVKIQREEAKQKGKKAVELPQTVFDESLEEEGGAVIEDVVERVGQPFKTTRTVPYWKYLLIQLDRKLKGKGKRKGKVRGEPINLRGKSADELLSGFDYERQEGGKGKGFMGRDLDEL